MSPYELWRQANGDRDEYKRLLREHGLLVSIVPGQCICPQSDPADDCSKLADLRTKCPVHGGTPAPAGHDSRGDP